MGRHNLLNSDLTIWGVNSYAHFWDNFLLSSNIIIGVRGNNNTLSLLYIFCTLTTNGISNICKGIAAIGKKIYSKSNVVFTQKKMKKHEVFFFVRSDLGYSMDILVLFLAASMSLV